MKRRAFAFIEVIIVVGVIGALTTLSIPLYREFQVRSDLDNATQQATQGLSRAKMLAQLGQQDSGWGFYVPSGTLYKGTSYASRDEQYDEVYPMPDTIAVSGLLDVAYSKVKGSPSATGDILLRALNNDQRIIQVTIAVDAQQIAANVGDTLTICHYAPGNPGAGNTMTIPDSAWPSHQAHGDSLGGCSGYVQSSSAPAVVTSSSSSAAVSSSSSSVAAEGSCTPKFTVASNGTITTNASTNVTFTNKLAQITFGAGGPPVTVHVCYTTDNGSNYKGIYGGGSGKCKGTGNAYGNAVKPAGTDTATVAVSAGKQLGIKVRGHYKQSGWLAFDEAYTSLDQTGHVKLLQDGVNLQNYPGFGSQTPLKNYLVSQGLANASGEITIGACDVLAISELGTLNSSAADFQDDVMLMSFN